MNQNRYRTILALIIVAVCALAVQAQSGRRRTTPPPAAPIPSPTPEPTPIPKKDEKAEEVMFLVGTDRNTGPAAIPLQFHSAAQRGCADRLRSRSSAQVDMAQRDLSRGEAIEKAKASPTTYVVLLTLTFDRMASSWDDLELDFVVFAPGTAKVVLTGRAYVNSSRAGPVVVGPTSRVPAGVFRETWVRQAGEEAADRILKKLHMGTPKPK